MVISNTWTDPDCIAQNARMQTQNTQLAELKEFQHLSIATAGIPLMYMTVHPASLRTRVFNSNSFSSRIIENPQNSAVPSYKSQEKEINGEES